MIFDNINYFLFLAFYILLSKSSKISDYLYKISRAKIYTKLFISTYFFTYFKLN